MLQEFEFEFNGKKYKMREANGSEDLAFQEICIDQLGRLKPADLWKRRIKKCMVEPMFTDAEFNELSHKELSFLIGKWLEVNEFDQSSFLGISNSEKKIV